MIKVGSKIKLPNDKKFMKTYINQKTNKEILSFFYNVYEKDNNNNKYIVKERYVIEIVNTIPNLGSTIIIDEIYSVQPKIAYDSKGKEYLNIYLWVKCTEQTQQKYNKNNYNNNNNNNNNNEFYNQNSFEETNDSLSDYADYI